MASSFIQWIMTGLRILHLLAAPSSTLQIGVPSLEGTLVPSNQLLQAVGSRIAISGSPVDLAVSPDSGTIALSVSNKVLLYNAAGSLQRVQQLPAGATYGGLAFSPDGQSLAVSHASGVSVFSVSSGSTVLTIPLTGSIPSGLAFDPIRPYVYVALTGRNQIARLDLHRLQVADTLTVGVAPVGIAVTRSGDRLFVSNWGGSQPTAGARTAITGGSGIVVDSRGIAASGAVSAIDLAAFRVLAEIKVGLHPSGIQASPDDRVVAVANANSDSVSFIETNSLTVVGTTWLAAFPQNFAGSSPTSVAFNGDGSRLYVACAGNNSVAALGLRAGLYEVAGFAPTDWYPVALAVSSRDGQDTVMVANAKGIGARLGDGPYNAGTQLGTLGQFQSSDLAGPDRIAALNDPFRSAALPDGSPFALSTLGIRHVFLIIKENRTYDQVLGDLGSGNGNPELAIYGANVTPNHHRLASTFVTLDNFYATGVVSAEGHQWITQAMTTDYIERSYTAGWPRSYPYSGEDAMAFAPTGFIWDNARSHGLAVRIFGEFTQAAASYPRTWLEYLRDAQSPRIHYATPSRSPVASLNDIIEPDFPTFAMNVPDQFRARVFLDKFSQYAAQDAMPNLVIIWLPGDHTVGLTPNMPSPQTMVADNDLALGNIVEAISTSSYWPKSAIFVTEDDAQDGVDHVDGHRTICLVASPYALRGAVDSTSYNQTSLVRTIEELLGMPPMNKFDAAALPMRSVFTTTPDFTPHFTAQSNLPFAMNPAVSSLNGKARKAALESKKMDFSKPDVAPEQKLNRVLWGSARGWNTRYPKPPHRRDCEMDDDDR